MKIGVLVCDHIQEKLQAEHGDYPQMFTRFIKEMDESFTINLYDVTECDLPAYIDECDAYMATGSQYSAYENHAWIDQLTLFVRELYTNKKPFVGICFGHQVIAMALGGNVEKSHKGWGIGVSRGMVQRELPWMTPMKEELNLMVTHQDQVTQLPPEGHILMGNAFCPNAMMQISDHFLGIQGHPEFTKSYLHDLVQTREEVIPEHVFKAGLDSLELKTDGKLLGQWIGAFYRQLL